MFGGEVLDIPKIDKRTRDEILEQIADMARSFTPEWNFSTVKPGMGSAAAMAYAKLANDTANKLNRTPEKNLIEFFSKLGASKLCFQPAYGYLCFEVSGNESNVAGDSVSAGSTFTAAGTSDVVFTLADDLYAVNSSLNGVVCTDPEKDSIHSLYSHYSDNSETPVFNTYCRIDDNLQKHALYIKYDYFEKNAEGTKVRMEFKLDHADDISVGNFENAVLRSGIFYSTDDGFARAQMLAIKNGGFVFQYDLKLPPAETTLFGQTGQWFKIPFEGETSLNDASRVYIEEVRIGTSAAGIGPDGIFDDFSQFSSTALFPFGKTLTPYSSVYFSCSSVLCRKGSTVTLEFKNHYSRIPINETDEYIDWKYVMKKSDFKKPKKYDVFVKNVVWEYFGGAGWMRLFPDDRFGDVFDGKNDGATVSISFVCPNDISSVFLPSGLCYAIRARVEYVENYLKQYGDYIIPQLFLPTFSYSYGELPESDILFTENCLDIRGHRLKNGSVQAAKQLCDEGKCLEFAFSSPLDKNGIGILFDIEGKNKSDKKYVWEYLSKNGWQALDCRDETGGLSETGLLTLRSNSGFVYREMYSHKGYWIRIRYENPKFCPDRSKITIYLNCAKADNIEIRGEELFSVTDAENICRLTQSGVYKAEVLVDELSAVSPTEADVMVKNGDAEPVYGENGNLARLFVPWSEYSGGAKQRTYTLDRDESCVVFGVDGSMPPKSEGINVLVRYSTCNGDKGNLEKDTDFTPNKNAGLISRIYNPFRMTGGAGKETLSAALERSASELRLRSRVRSESDFSDAVKAIDRSVVKVKTFGGRGVRGEFIPGAVTVAVLFKDEECFSEKCARLEKALSSMCSPFMRGGKPNIVKPYAVTCSISVTASVKSSDLVSRVREWLYERFAEYFDIENGNIDKKGWEIGQLPDKSMIYGYLMGTPEVEKLEDFELVMTDENGEALNITELEELKKTGMAIARAGNAEITVKII